MLITFGNVAVSGTYPSVAYQLLLGVEADLCVRVGSAVVLDEPHFPIVELRQWLAQWLSAGAVDDFTYTSIEADEDGLLSFQQTEQGDWLVGAAWSALASPAKISRACLLSACQYFVGQVDAWVASNLHLSVSDVLMDLR